MIWNKFLALSAFLLCMFLQSTSSNSQRTGSISTNAIYQSKLCGKFSYQCKDDSCISIDKFCDRRKDCKDGSDEYSNCTNDRTCMDYEFRCANGYCVYKKKICDGIDDCLDNSDELNCHINPCEKNALRCDQLCRDKNDSYECYCAEGYELQSDNKTCKANKNDAETLLVYAAKDSVESISLPSLTEKTLVSHINEPLAVGIDALNVYWSEETPDRNAIFRSKRYTNMPQAIITTGLEYIEEIAIDWVTNNIYFIDAIRVKFGVCTNNGSYCTLILRGLHNNPNGLVLDPSDGMMYWSEWGFKSGSISKANMDGKNRKLLVHKDIGMPQSLAYDYPTKRLYWRDAILNHIGSIDSDGNNRQVIMQIDSTKTHNIGVFEDRLYWSDYTMNSIESCNKLTGEDRKILKNNLERIRGMHLYHILVKPNIHNPCKLSNCSEICLLAGNNSYTCACSLDKELSEDGHTCKIHSKQQYLMFVTNSLFFNYYGELIGRPTIKSHDVFKHFTVIAYDSLNSGIFVDNPETQLIYRFDIKTGKMEDLKGVKTQKISGMSFDYIGNNLYWTDSRKNTIEIYNLDSKKRGSIKCSFQPSGIVVIPERAEMFVVYYKDSQRHLAKLSMSGSFIGLFLKDFIGTRISLAYDSETKRLFWADSDVGYIKSIGIDGTSEQTLQSRLGDIADIAILDQHVYWTLHNRTEIFRANKTLTKPSTFQLSLPLINKHEILHIIMTNDHNNKFDHECRKSHGNCSHVCLMSSLTSYTCACPTGLYLQSDNRTCEAPKVCQKNELKCPDKTCLNENKFCDGYEDCSNGSDEYCGNRKNICSENEFQCFDDKMCIPNSRLCDGASNCDDDSDEKNCKYYNCHDTTWVNCLSTNRCIPRHWGCDGETDCEDGTDERPFECKNLVCHPNMDACDNEMCIHHSLTCNHENDCGDNSDEQNCSYYKRGQSETEFCKINEYRCYKTNICIPMSARCDQHSDCQYHDDEDFCSDCNIDQFTCDNYRCIPMERICDKYDDCGDNSDEEFCDSNRNIHDSTNLLSSGQPSVLLDNENKFKCDNGEYLNYEKVCDGYANCADKSDEGAGCAKMCPTTNNCESYCHTTPKGPVCICQSGYKLEADNKTCVDIDECALGACSQICKNKPGSFRCDCMPGFSLRRDKRACKTVIDSLEIITATKYDVRRALNKLREFDILDRTKNMITGLDINIRENLVYWSEEDSGTITEYNINTGLQRLLIRNKKPNILAVDWITGNIYFYNNSQSSPSIVVCTQYNDKCATIITWDYPNTLTSLTVDSKRGFIYWARTISSNEKSSKSIIYRSHMNGKNIIVISSKNNGVITGIATHPTRSELFWADLSQQAIFKSHLDGTHVEIFRRVKQPLGLNIFDDSVYWVMSTTRTLYGCPISNDKIQCQPISIAPSHIDDFFVISHFSRHADVQDVCKEDNTCSWICTNQNEIATCIVNDDDLKKSMNETDTSLETVRTVISIAIYITAGSLIIVVIFMLRNIIRKAYRMITTYFSHIPSHNVSFRHTNLSEDEAATPMVGLNIHSFENPLSVSNSNLETELVPLRKPEIHSLEFKKENAKEENL